MKILTYSEMMQFETLEDRYEYLKLSGSIGRSTFGFDRYLNQTFYRSKEWRDLRHHVIVRDEARDLAVPGYSITSKILVHHMNPITPDQIEQGDSSILDPEYLVCCSHQTHNAIHFGDESLLPMRIVERTPGDTRLW